MAGNIYHVIESDDNDDDDEEEEEAVKEVEELEEEVEKVEKEEEEDKFRFNDVLIHEGRLRKNCILTWFSIEKAKKIRNTITHVGI